jgi:hypothetical protein
LNPWRVVCGSESEPVRTSEDLMAEPNLGQEEEMEMARRGEASHSHRTLPTLTAARLRLGMLSLMLGRYS